MLFARWGAGATRHLRDSPVRLAAGGRMSDSVHVRMFHHEPSLHFWTLLGDLPMFGTSMVFTIASRQNPLNKLQLGLVIADDFHASSD